jgi:hypothetical protein
MNYSSIPGKMRISEWILYGLQIQGRRCCQSSVLRKRAHAKPSTPAHVEL